MSCLLYCLSTLPLQVKAMVGVGGEASGMGLDISLYSAGIVCGDLLARVEWACDYARKRIGFRWVPPPPSLCLAHKE